MKHFKKIILVLICLTLLIGGIVFTINKSKTPNLKGTEKITNFHRGLKK